MSKDPVRVNHHVQHRYPLGIRFCPLCAGKLEERILLPDGREHKVCSECGFVHFLGPKLVSGCLVIDGDRVLLLRRGIEPEIGKWTFPGGFVDFGETPAQAALRETLEEVGMRVRIDRHLGLYADPANPHAAVAAYLATPGEEPPGTSDEALEVRYFGPAEIPWDDIAFLTTREALRDWLALIKSPQLQLKAAKRDGRITAARHGVALGARCRLCPEIITPMSRGRQALSNAVEALLAFKFSKHAGEDLKAQALLIARTGGTPLKDADFVVETLDETE